MKCPYCDNELLCLSEVEYDEVYGEGKGIVIYLKCTSDSCNTYIEISKRDE